MQTVILCGGKGSRIGSETQIKPKPLIDVGNKPVLWHIMRTYYSYGHDDFVLCLGYKGDMIKKWFMEPTWRHYDFKLLPTSSPQPTWPPYILEEVPEWKVTFADTGEESDTGERVRRASKYITDRFFLTYGDGVANINIDELLRFHMAHGKLATITMVYPTSRFGNVSIGPNGRIIKFSEKTARDEAVNGGFMVFEREALDYFKPNYNLERDVLSALVADDQLHAYDHRGYWQCMDTAKEVELLNREYERGNAPWVVW